MLKVQYIDLSLDIYSKKDIKDYYPCGEVNGLISILPKDEVRIFDCIDGKKYLDMWISEDNSEVTIHPVRMLLNTLKVFDTIGTKDPASSKYPEDSLLGYQYKSINYIYLVLSVSEYTKNVLYYFNGCSSKDELTLNDSDPFVYRNGNTVDRVFDYYDSPAELASSVGEFKYMVPTFLKNMVRVDDPDSGGTIVKKQTIAPYTMGAYVFLSDGTTVEDNFTQIGKFHRMNTSIVLDEDSNKIEFTPPTADFFEYYGEITNNVIKCEYVDVFIGSTYVAPERYKITQERKNKESSYRFYISFIEDTSGKIYTVKSGRTVYINYSYNTHPNVKSPIMTLIDGGDIMRKSIPTDRLQNTTTDINSDDADVVVTSAALSKLREEFISNLSRYTGNNILHANSIYGAETYGAVAPQFVYTINGEDTILNKKTGSTIFLKLDRDMITNAKICIRNIYTDSTKTTKWGDDTLYPIYTYDDQPFKTYVDASKTISTDISAGTDYPVARYDLKAGQIVQLIYNDIKDGEPRFYINSGERYRLVNTTATCTYQPVASQSSYSVSDLYIYLTDPGVPDVMIMKPYLTYNPGVDLIILTMNGRLLRENIDYTYEPENKRIRIPDVDNIDTSIFSITVTSVRSII